MSKKEHSAKRQPAKLGERSLPNRLVDDLNEVEGLTRRKRWNEARDALEELNRRYPNRPEVLTYLVSVHFELRAMPEYQAAFEQSSEMMPDDPDIALELAGAHATNDRPTLALKTFRRFIERWPDHADVGRAPAAAAKLEVAVNLVIEDMSMSGEDGFDFASLHEQARVYAEQQKFAAARRTLDELLRRRPNFAPTLNNLSILYFAQGQLTPAIEASQRVLAFAPDNIHALSNLIRLRCLSGRAIEAPDYAERLKLSTAAAFQGWLKKMEGLACLGDDAGVLALVESAQHDPDVADNPMIYHLAR